MSVESESHKEAKEKKEVSLAKKLKSAATKSKRYVLGMNERLAKRLDSHMRVLKIVDGRTVNRQSWVLNAIHTKLEQDKDAKMLNVGKPKYIAIPLSPEMVIELEKRMDLMKKLTGYSSQKKWIIEAIEEQFEREEHKVLELPK